MKLPQPRPALRRFAASYLRAAPLPHIFTGLSLTALAGQLIRQADLCSFQALESSAWHWLGLMFSLGVLFCTSSDAYCRFLEYRRFKRLFRRFGFRPKLFRVTGRSRCQRDAMLQAARECGLAAQAAREFQAQGYRWYHLIPDQVMANPLFFFHPRFLRSTFWPG